MRPHMEEIRQQMQDSMDPNSIAEGQKQIKKLFKEYGVTPFTPLKGLLIQGPVVISFYLAISNMVEKVPSLKEGYDIENSSTLPINRRNTTAMPPSVAGVPSSYNPEATIQNGNESQVTVLPVPPVISHSSHSCSCFIYTHLVLLILLLAIL